MSACSVSRLIPFTRRLVASSSSLSLSCCRCCCRQASGKRMLSVGTTKNNTNTTTTSINPEERIIPSSSSPFSQVTDVSDLAQEIRASVREYTRTYLYSDAKSQKNGGVRNGKDKQSHTNNHTHKRKIKLVGILSANGPFRADAENYSRHIAETCREDGIQYELYTVLGEGNPAVVEDAIRINNKRPDVDGILVYYPIYKKEEHQQDQQSPYHKNRLTGVYYKTQDDCLRNLVCPTKDVEGLGNEYNARSIFRFKNGGNQKNTSKTNNLQQSENAKNIVYPCTALSVARILERYGNIKAPAHWHGKVVTIVNRSEIFGRPLAAMLAQKGATVFSIDAHSILLFRSGGRIRQCHTGTGGLPHSPTCTLEWCLQQSSMVVTGVPSPDFYIPCESIQPGTTLVNVSEYANVDEESLLDIPNVQYVPHVGKVTVASLEQNLVELHKKFANNCK